MSRKESNPYGGNSRAGAGSSVNDKALKEFEATLKSCIISRKGGIPINELTADYRDLTGEVIPYEKFGHTSLYNLLTSVQGVTVRSGIVYATGQNTAHLERLISKQKTQKFRKKPIGDLKYRKVKQNHYTRQNVLQQKIRSVAQAVPKTSYYNTDDYAKSIVNSSVFRFDTGSNPYSKINPPRKATEKNITNKENVVKPPTLPTQAAPSKPLQNVRPVIIYEISDSEDENVDRNDPKKVTDNVKVIDCPNTKESERASSVALNNNNNILDKNQPKDLKPDIKDIDSANIQVSEETKITNNTEPSNSATVVSQDCTAKTLQPETKDINSNKTETPEKTSVDVSNEKNVELPTSKSYSTDQITNDESNILNDSVTGDTIEIFDTVLNSSDDGVSENKETNNSDDDDVASVYSNNSPIPLIIISDSEDDCNTRNKDSSDNKLQLTKPGDENEPTNKATKSPNNTASKTSVNYQVTPKGVIEKRNKNKNKSPPSAITTLVANMTLSNRANSANRIENIVSSRNSPNCNSQNASSHRPVRLSPNHCYNELNNVINRRCQIACTFEKPCWKCYYCSSAPYNPVYNCFLSQLNSMMSDYIRNNQMVHFFNQRFTINGYEVIGDAYFTDLAINNYGCLVKDLLVSICSPCLTLRGAYLHLTDMLCSYRVVIMCGSIDAHMSMSCSEMITNMKTIIDFLQMCKITPVLCCVPPSKNPSVRFKIRRFNAWLRSLRNFQIVDLYTPFVFENDKIKHKLFESFTVSVNNCSIHLWNKHGLQRARHELTRSLPWAW